MAPFTYLALLASMKIIDKLVADPDVRRLVNEEGGPTSDRALILAFEIDDMVDDIVSYVREDLDILSQESSSSYESLVDATLGAVGNVAKKNLLAYARQAYGRADEDFSKTF